MADDRIELSFKSHHEALKYMVKWTGPGMVLATLADVFDELSDEYGDDTKDWLTAAKGLERSADTAYVERLG